MRSKTNKITSPIFVTGADRSGSALIARILRMRGVYAGEINNMFENRRIQDLTKQYIKENSKTPLYPELDSLDMNWQEKVVGIIDGKVKDQWMFKSPLITQTWKQWHYAFPDAKWLIIRRRSADIINSCNKTAYMSLFDDPKNQELAGAENQIDAWKWWIHKYQDAWIEMMNEGVNCKVIWPERMATGDYAQIYEMLDWLGLDWCPSIPNVIHPLMNKENRRNK